MTLVDLIRKRDRGHGANANPAKVAKDGVVSVPPLAGLAPLALANPTEAKLANEALGAKGAFEERAAIMEFDGQLDRESAERRAHEIVFCRDCVHHLPQPDAVSRTGAARPTPSGCKLGLVTPKSWPPIYSFTGWVCPSHAKPKEAE